MKKKKVYSIYLNLMNELVRSRSFIKKSEATKELLYINWIHPNLKAQIRLENKFYEGE